MPFAPNDVVLIRPERVSLNLAVYFLGLPAAVFRSETNLYGICYKMVFDP
jgi:hypothetical protein